MAEYQRSKEPVTFNVEKLIVFSRGRRSATGKGASAVLGRLPVRVEGDMYHGKKLAGIFWYQSSDLSDVVPSLSWLRRCLTKLGSVGVGDEVDAKKFKVSEPELPLPLYF